MKNLLAFVTRYYHWFLFALLEIISGVLLFRANNYQSSVWFSSANAVAGSIYRIDASVRSYFSLARLNEELTLRNFYMERQLAQLRRLYADATHDTTAVERQGLAMISQFVTIPAKVVSNSVD